MRVPVQGLVLPALASLLLLSAIGCDSQPGFEQDLEKRCPGEVIALSSPADLRLYAGEADTTIAVASHSLFAHTTERQLGYSARSSASDLMGVEASGSDTLRIEIWPLQAGEAEVTIKATDVCGQSQTVAFTVEVVDVCSLVANQEYDVYFPINVGNVWTYGYRDSEQDANIPYNLTTGTLQWELTSATACEDGRQDFSIREIFDGVTTLPYDNPDYRQEQSWTRTLTGEIKGRALHLGRYTEELSVQWVYPPSTSDTVVVQDSEGVISYGREDWMITLKRNTGIKQWNTSRNGPHTYASGTGIILGQ